MQNVFNSCVSIQPKPKNGLEVYNESAVTYSNGSFNPAEAEEWFRRQTLKNRKHIPDWVSIQPKPKNGLEGMDISRI